MLFALGAAALPVIVHLFHFRRPRKVDFSSLTFVRELQKTTMQRVRLRQWLLLALRLLAIVCLVCAFARPSLTGQVAGAVGGAARSSAALVVDNSLSMTLRDAEGEYLRQAKDIVSGLIREFEERDEIFLRTTAGDDVPRRPLSPAAAIDAVEDIRASAAGVSLLEAVASATEALEEAAHPNREVYIVSDMQAPALADTVRAVQVEGIRAYLLPIGGRKQANVAVVDVRIDSRIVEAGRPVRLSATLANYADEPVEGYVASVFLEGRRLAQATADLLPGEPTEVNFTVTPPGSGWLSGVVQIEEDVYPFDDQRYFTLHVPERRRILIVRGEGENTGFLELALSPELARGQVAFDVTIIPETSLAATGPEGYDAVVVAGAQTLSSGETEVLARYVAGGGGLLLSPSSSGQDYNALLERVGGGRISGFNGSLGSQTRIASFDRVELEHPLFEGVFHTEEEGDAPNVERPEIWFAARYEPESAGEQSIIRLSNGDPFLQEIRHERGVALLLAVAPDARWSELPVRGLFIPLMYRSLYYLSAYESISGEQFPAARSAELRIARPPGEALLRLAGPDGTEYVPEQRDLFDAALLMIDEEAVERSGVYDVSAGDEIVRRIAFNVDERESDMFVLEAEEARRRLAEVVGAPVEIIAAGERSVGDVVEAVAEQRRGRELWKAFLLLALLFLAAEMVVAKGWRPTAKEGTSLFAGTGS